MDGSALRCDEMIQSCDDETSFNEKRQLGKQKISMFY